MKKRLILSFLVFSFLFIKSISVHGQSLNRLIANATSCPLSNVGCLVEMDGGPLGSRIPVIIIPGWNPTRVPANPKLDLWDPFISFYFGDSQLQARFKIYFYLYYSNYVDVISIARSLRDEVDLKSTQDPVFGSKPFVILAHSMGGLIARSFMQEYRVYQGSYAGRFGGDRVLKLITLGTPHHGSVMANGPARDYKTFNVSGLLQLLFDNLFYFVFGPPWYAPNRSDMWWDNFDGLFDLSKFPDERNTWLQNLNVSRIYDNKIVAYAGDYIVSGSTCSGFAAFSGYCYGSAIMADSMSLASDGIVPLISAMFSSSDIIGISRVASRSFFDNYNHDQIVTGKTGSIGDKLFTYLRSDLLSSGSSPFGSFDTPANNSLNSGEVALSGWALDDMKVSSVDIYRSPGNIYVGSANFVYGARPDIAGSYPLLFNNTRAGWGYMLMTNLLPNQGNGTFTFSVYAKDSDGQSALLGTKTLTFNNSSSAKPFGTIDTPGQGETISGVYTNFGWALTPRPNSIAISGVTIDVYVDNIFMGHPTYNNYRQDIANLFPGLANSNGAIGYFRLDTRILTNSLHTISWIVRDSVGNSQGIGSRYFVVSN